MQPFDAIRRGVAAVGRWWWDGLERLAREQVRAEVEALERYRDRARGWDAHGAGSAAHQPGAKQLK